jgi:hypothetical protein
MAAIDTSLVKLEHAAASQIGLVKGKTTKATFPRIYLNVPTRSYCALLIRMCFKKTTRRATKISNLLKGQKCKPTFEGDPNQCQKFHVSISETIECLNMLEL